MRLAWVAESAKTAVLMSWPLKRRVTRYLFIPKFIVTPTWVNLFHKALTQFDGGSFNLGIKLPCLHGLLYQFQGGYQFRCAGNLNCTLVLADLTIACAIKDVQCELIGLSGPPPSANTAWDFNAAATAIRSVTVRIVVMFLPLTPVKIMF